MHLRPQSPLFSNDAPVWNGTVHSSWDGRYEACGEVAYRLGGCLVTENAKCLQLFFYVPNVKVNHLKVEVIDDVIHLSGTQSATREVSRSLAIDTDKFDVTHLEANLKDGVLLVKAPKKNLRVRFFRNREKELKKRQEEQQDIEVTFVEARDVTEGRRDTSPIRRDQGIIGKNISF